MLSGTFASAKPIKEFDRVQLLDIEKGPNKWSLYLVAGANKVFLLGPESGDDWARLLTPTELEGLPYDIIWSGEDTKFEANSLKATELSRCNFFSCMQAVLQWMRAYVRAYVRACVCVCCVVCVCVCEYTFL